MTPATRGQRSEQGDVEEEHVTWRYCIDSDIFASILTSCCSCQPSNRMLAGIVDSSIWEAKKSSNACYIDLIVKYCLLVLVPGGR